MIDKKNEIIVIAGGLIIALFLLGLFLYSRSTKINENEDVYFDEITTQSQSTEIDDIEKDLLETDLENIDRELQLIEDELDEAL